ncbi:MAG: hypothetical protein ACKVS8_13670 [Phycisphaerales bacterium]
MTHDKHQHTPELRDAADPWHTHTTDEALPHVAHSERVNVPVVVAYGTACFIAIVVVCVVTVVYFNWYVTKTKIAREEQVDNGPTTNSVLQAEYLNHRKGVEEVDFKQTGWIDGEKNIVRIPLDVAMKKVVDQYARRAK